jgi:transposase-like protein
VSTREVEDPVKAFGTDAGISKPEVPQICTDLDEEVGAFRDRTLGQIAYPYVFLDATYRRPGVKATNDVTCGPDRHRGHRRRAA